MITYGKFLELVKVAEDLGGSVVFDSKKKIKFSTNLTITVPLSTTFENVYALAHEIGHLVDYINGKLDYDKWLNNWSYRVNAEMSAWVNAYNILLELDISLEKWHNHVNEKLSTYFIHPEVVI